MEFELLTRKGCGLCDELEEALVAVLEICEASGQHATLILREVDSDPELARRFGRHVPVLRVGGAVLCAHRLDPQRVGMALDGQPWEPLDLR